MGEIRIGAQGWNYADWVGPLYPRGSRAAEYLDLYVRAFDTVEIDSTFYAIPAEGAVRSWRRRAGEGFIYSLKLPQEITHVRRLGESAEILDVFCARARELGEHLGVILIQLPPDFSPRARGALEAFLKLLPRDLRFAVEFRDRAWVAEERLGDLLELLGAQHTALALCDSKWMPRETMMALAARPTADFSYLRWLGPRELTEYSRLQIDHTRELEQWAAVVAALSAQVSVVYAYFNNHYEGHSPLSANRFKKMLGLDVIDPETLISQPSLF